MKHLSQRLVYLFVRAIAFSIRLLPLPWVSAVGRGLGTLFYVVDAKHRRITLANLAFAFGRERTEEELQGIARGAYQNLACCVTELMKLSSFSSSQIGRWVTLEGMEHYETARAERKGILLLGAHFGNWELMSIVICIRANPLFAVARPLNNIYLDRFMRGLRERFGNRVLDKIGALKEVSQLLKKGESIGFLLDQNVSGRSGVFVPFFGQPASTNKGLAVIALRTGAPVVPVFIVRGGSGHRVVFEKEIALVRTGNLEKDIVENTARFTGVIESQIRRYPDHWLWMHRRWKTQAKGL